MIEYDALDRVKRVTRTEGATVGVEDYAYNALGALKLNAGVTLDDQRPRLDGGGQADAAVPATFAGQPVTLDPGGRVTSFGGATYEYATTPWILRSITPPAPDPKIRFGQDTDLRRIAEVRGTSVAEFYYYEGQDRVATVGPSTTGVLDAYLFDGIDHPLRIKRGSAVVYYELDLAGNVRGLRLSGGSDLGGYRYTAFGKTTADTSTFVQPLRWKGRWWHSLAGREVYDVRARQWSPELGVFLSIDGYEFHNDKTALWGWPGQSPIKNADPSGHGKICIHINVFLKVCFEWPDKPPTPPPAPPPGPPPPGPDGGRCPKPKPAACNDPCDMNEGKANCDHCCDFNSADPALCKKECCPARF